MDFLKLEAFRGEILCRTVTAPVSGMTRIQVGPASRDTWLSWLHFGISAEFYERSPYREDQLLEMFSGLVEGWVIVASYGRCCLYEIRATAWKFLGTLVALISLDNDDYVNSAMKAFENTWGPPKAPKSALLHEHPRQPAVPDLRHVGASTPGL